MIERQPTNIFYDADKFYIFIPVPWNSVIARGAIIVRWNFAEKNGIKRFDKLELQLAGISGFLTKPSQFFQVE